MAIDMSQFYQVFFEESEEHLATMESLLLGIDVAHPDPEDLNAIFRAAHSIKGSAGTFGFTDLAQTTHVLENLLDRIRKEELVLRPAMVDAFLAAGDLLRQMLQGHQGGHGVAQADVDAMCERLKELTGVADTAAASGSGGSAGETGSTAQRFDITFVPTPSAREGNGVLNLLSAFSEIGSLEILHDPGQAADASAYWHLRLLTGQSAAEIEEQVDFIAEAGAWRVSAGAPDPEADAAYGLFEPLATETAQEEVDYGFFAPLPTPAEPAAAAEAVEETAYGLFAPPAAVPENMPAAEETYGFFAPLEAAPASSYVAPAVAEEGEGYGLFVVPKVDAPAIPPPAPPASREPRIALEAPAPRSGKSTVASGGGDSSIRVNVEKVDQLINLVGELVITQAMLLQTASQLGEAAPERLQLGLTQLERNTRDLQESVMSIRMLPISFVFSRFPRVVRDLSAKLGKQVELKTMGETTELDKSLIERIADPLTHLIRNSLDHGIELPEERVAAGKAASGTITLKASHQGGNIVIEVGDDGRGLSREKILGKARERGLAVSEQMSDQEVFALIFEAGFSTAEQVTDVSGRGVGMDVVRRNIQGMGGRVEIDSLAGVGTRMTVRLPLTLAILDGMSVAVGDQIYIVPLSSVIESLQPQPGDLKSVAKQGRVVQVRGDYLPIVSLYEVFNLAGAQTDPAQGILIVLEADGLKVALLVDALLGQHQVVIKSLEANYRRVPGVSGATIMGDGHVAMILDVAALVGMSRNRPPELLAVA